MADGTRHEDPLVSSLRGVMQNSTLPQYLRQMYADVVAWRFGQLDHDPETLLHKVLGMQFHAHRLTHLIADPTLQPAAVACARAEMRAFVMATRLAHTDWMQHDPQAFAKVTLAILKHIRSFPLQTVMHNQRVKLESLQLSHAQHAGIAEKAMTLFEQQRSFRAQRNSLTGPFAAVVGSSGPTPSVLSMSDPQQLTTFACLLDRVIDIRNQEMLALSSTLSQIIGTNLLSDEQWVRILSFNAENGIATSSYLSLVALSESWRKPRIPAPAPALQADLNAATWTQPCKRARHRSPQPHRESAAPDSFADTPAAQDQDINAGAAPCPAHDDVIGELLGEAARAPDFMSFLAELGQPEPLLQTSPQVSSQDAQGNAVSLAAGNVLGLDAEASVHSPGRFLTTPPDSPPQRDQPEHESELSAAQRILLQLQQPPSDEDSDRTTGPPPADDSAALLFDDYTTSLQLPINQPALLQEHLLDVVTPSASPQQPSTPHRTAPAALDPVVQNEKHAAAAAVEAPAQPAGQATVRRRALDGRILIPSRLSRPPFPQSRLPMDHAAVMKDGMHAAEGLRDALSDESSEWTAINPLNMHQHGIQDLLAM